MQENKLASGIPTSLCKLFSSQTARSLMEANGGGARFMLNPGCFRARAVTIEVLYDSVARNVLAAVLFTCCLSTHVMRSIETCNLLSS